MNSILKYRHFYSDVKDHEIIIMSSNNDIDIKSTFYFLNCENCNILIYPKILNIIFENCKNINILYTDVVNKVDLFRCNDVTMKSFSFQSTIVESSTNISIISFNKVKNLYNVITNNCWNINCIIKNKKIPVKWSMFSDFYITEIQSL